jgi:hypothetical protein
MIPDEASAPDSLSALSPRERNRLRLLLALRYRVRRDTTLRPMADVMFDLRLRRRPVVHGQVFELLGGRVKR